MDSNTFLFKPANPKIGNQLSVCTYMFGCIYLEIDQLSNLKIILSLVQNISYGLRLLTTGSIAYKRLSNEFNV